MIDNIDDLGAGYTGKMSTSLLADNIFQNIYFTLSMNIPASAAIAFSLDTFLRRNSNKRKDQE
jgi:hypothetical protein